MHYFIITLLTPSQGKIPSNQPMTANKTKEAYALYARNIDLKDLQVHFDGAIGKPVKVHGDNKSFRTKNNVVFKSTTMHTSDGKFECWVYRGGDYKWVQDGFDIEEPTKEEWSRSYWKELLAWTLRARKLISSTSD
jgi:hypothetical protein